MNQAAFDEIRRSWDQTRTGRGLTVAQRARPGSDHVRLVRRLRNHFAHGDRRLDAKKKGHPETWKLLAEVFPGRAARRPTFDVPIDEVLEPLVEGVLEFIRASP
jgi:hypothetical protein